MDSPSASKTGAVTVGLILRATITVALLATPVALLESSEAAPIAVLQSTDTYTVNTTDDSDDADPGDGICETTSGNEQCSLRAAIEESFAHPELSSTVLFDIPTSDPGYNGMFWTIGLLSALPDLSNGITIEGPGPALLTLTRSSASAFRIFHVTGTGIVTLSGLTMTNGDAGSENGGAILKDGTGMLNVTGCALSSNSASRGGGISNRDAGTTNVTDTTITNNVGNDRGGGILNQDIGVINIISSTISYNDGIDGAGIRQSDLGIINVSNCTISRNVSNSGLGNGNGGSGIYNAIGGTVFVSNCTISSNIGPGLVNASDGSFSVKSSIIALNGGSSKEGPRDVSGTFNSAGFNLIGEEDGGTGFSQDTDQTGSRVTPLDPGLDPLALQDHGGPTLTIALLPLSPALDKGTSVGFNGNLVTDQRGSGFARTFDDPGIPNAVDGDGTDIGAFEAQTVLPTPTPTPTITPTPTPTPTPTRLGNISTRLSVGTADNVLIGGFIIAGSEQKTILIRAIGPSLPLSGALTDPVLQLYDSSSKLVAANDNWKDNDNAQAIIDSGIQPPNDKESAILLALDPGAYTAVVSGANSITGIALVEVYDLDQVVDSKLANISTRGLVQTGDNVMIGGIIVLGSATTTTLVRGLGPSLPLSGALADPTLELHDSNGNLIASNDNWKDTQQAAIEATGIAPTNDAEAAILVTLAPGSYTAIVLGKNESVGVSLVEFYQVDPQTFPVRGN